MAAQPVRLASTARSKYRAQPTVVDGIRFHSAKESRRYAELKLLEKAGEIQYLGLQPVFTLFAPGREAGTSVELGRYIADFSYLTKEGVEIVEDVKGVRTPLYRWKKKHVEAQYGITIREIH